MEFGIQVRGDWRFVLSAAQWAEQRDDVLAIALPDHYLQRGDEPEQPAWDHLVHLSALASATERLELVSLVSPVTFRHPAVMLKIGVTIDEVSDGRFALGLGAGWLEEEFTRFGIPFPDVATRMEMYEEALGYLRAAITPGALGFSGDHYQLDAFDPRPHPKRLRLIGGGAGGPKARAIAAKYCDEYNLYARPWAEFAEIRRETRASAVEIGRDPDEIKWSSAGPGVAAKKESDYRRMLEGIAELTGRPTDRIESVWDERGYPHGSGSKAAEMIEELDRAGCERFYPQLFLGEDDPSDFDLVLDAYAG